MRLCVSEITLAELYYGASKSKKKGMKEEVDFIADMFEIVPIRSSLELYGENKAILEERGERIDDFNLLIGSSAIQNNLIVVTENVKHLGRIPNITIENYPSLAKNHGNIWLFGNNLLLLHTKRVH